MGPGTRATDLVGMTPHTLLETDSDAPVVLDLRDEEALAAEHYAVHDPDGVRSLLAALNLKPHGGGVADTGADGFERSVFRATGDHRLASLFGSAR